MDIDALVKAWLKPEFVPMFAAVTLALKYVVIPLVKAFVGQTDERGYTSVKIAFGSSIVLCGLFRLTTGGAWDVSAVAMTVLTAVFAAFAAIGLNVTSQAAQGNDVSIK